MLRLDHEWLWDSWIACDGDIYHLYFLKAPRSLADPGLRHERATIGHATSRDLHTWTYLGTSFAPSTQGWDDLAIWTGSTVRDHDGRWHMFYTALGTRSGHGVRAQRIGRAVSADLHEWRRTSESPLLVADPRWYKTLPDNTGASETWRDPFVFADPRGEDWHMLITARAIGAEPNDDGVIGHARSPNLRDWTIGPPLSEPGFGFGQLEVPQVRMIDGAPVLVFTCHPQEMSERRRAESGGHCSWSVVGETLLGPWDFAHARPFAAEPTLFAARLVQRRDETWALLGFLNPEPEEVPPFELTDPRSVRLVDGGLQAID